jgi:cytoskeletal protein CcmA (bactofilin family)
MASKVSIDSSRFARGSVLKGRLTGEGDAHLFGELEGTLRWGGRLVVESGGRVKASGSVKDLLVCGELRGDLEVAGEGLVRSGGSWHGSGKAASLGTDPGAVVEGTFRIGPTALSARATGTADSPENR